MEDDRREPAGDLLGGRREGLLALVLAEVKLGGRGNLNVNDPVWHEPRSHLVEPGSIERGMPRSHLLEHVAPKRWIERGRFSLPPRGGLAKLGCRHVAVRSKSINAGFQPVCGQAQ